MACEVLRLKKQEQTFANVDRFIGAAPTKQYNERSRRLLSPFLKHGLAVKTPRGYDFTVLDNLCNMLEELEQVGSQICDETFRQALLATTNTERTPSTESPNHFDVKEECAEVLGRGLPKTDEVRRGFGEGTPRFWGGDPECACNTHARRAEIELESGGREDASDTCGDDDIEDAPEHTTTTTQSPKPSDWCRQAVDDLISMPWCGESLRARVEGIVARVERDRSDLHVPMAISSFIDAAENRYPRFRQEVAASLLHHLKTEKPYPGNLVRVPLRVGRRPLVPASKPKKETEERQLFPAHLFSDLNLTPSALAMATDPIHDPFSGPFLRSLQKLNIPPQTIADRRAAASGTLPA